MKNNEKDSRKDNKKDSRKDNKKVDISLKFEVYECNKA